MIGVSYLETETIIQLAKQLRDIKKDEELDSILKPLIDKTAPNLISILGVNYRLGVLLLVK